MSTKKIFKPNKDVNVEIGKRLAELRNNLCMSQKKVAEKLNFIGCDITNKALSKYEKGDIAVPLDVLIGLSDLYHADMNYIIKGEEPKQPCPYLKLEEMTKSSKEISDFFATLLAEFKK